VSCGFSCGKHGIVWVLWKIEVPKYEQAEEEAYHALNPTGSE